MGQHSHPNQKVRDEGEEEESIPEQIQKDEKGVNQRHLKTRSHSRHPQQQRRGSGRTNNQRQRETETDRDREREATKRESQKRETNYVILSSWGKAETGAAIFAQKWKACAVRI